MGYNYLATRNGHNMYDMASMLQKAIRRGDVRLAGYAGMELFTSFHKYLWKRLLVISAEDVWGIMTKEIIALYQADQIANEGRSKTDKDPLFAAKAIVLLCTAKKNRDGCYFACNFMLPDKTIPEDQIDHADVFEIRRLQESDIPDYVFDCHTIKGKKMGKTDVDMAIDEQEALSPKQIGLFDDCNWSDYFEWADKEEKLSAKERRQYDERLKNKRTP